MTMIFAHVFKEEGILLGMLMDYVKEKAKEKDRRATLDLYYTQSSSGSIELMKSNKFHDKFNLRTS